MLRMRMIDPQGSSHVFFGRFNDFCEENDLLTSALKRYKGQKVPPINTNGFGGYRAKNEVSKRRRINTIGWTLI